ncbi:hypothetical protein EDB89DRAFT_2113197 [Lactarius sanguifluus]|nr:hypothetical protein EDB89DRAFT_2113197 [Lactarius sanguifluus]
MSWFNKRKEKNLIPPSLKLRALVRRVTRIAAGQGDVDSDRNALFSGYNPENVTGRFAHEENEDDIEAIKQQTRPIKQDGLNSTRNALRMAHEAEETARSTINRLGGQSLQKLANTERHLDVAKGHSQCADDRTDELKQLNHSIFRPTRNAAQEAKVLQRYEEEREEREKAMGDIRETQNRLGQASTYGSREEGGGAGPNGRRAAQQSLQKEQRTRYQSEATASDDELEDELGDNLDEILDELDHQNNRIERIEEKTVSVDNRVFRNTRGYLKQIK